MKKRKLLFSLLFALLSIFGIGLAVRPAGMAHAAGVFTVTFDACGGTCETSSIDTKDDGTLESLPTSSKTGYIFSHWERSSGVKVDLDTAFSSNETVIAIYYAKVYNYTISMSAGKFSVVGQTTYSSLTYTLSDELTSVSSAISLIAADVNSATANVVIDFEDISLTENLNLSFASVKIGGNINLGAYQIIFTAPQNQSDLFLEDLIISSTSAQNQITVSGVNRTNITIKNCEFNDSSSSTTANNYAIFLENTKHYFNLSNKICHQTKFLYNHGVGMSATQVNDNLNLTSQPNGKISITVPYALDGLSVLSTNLEASNFSFVPNQSNFTCNSNKLGSNIYLQAQFNMNFDANKGDAEQDAYVLSTRFGRSDALNFDSQSLTKTHYTFNGFAGVVNIDTATASAYSMGSVYYFNKQALNNLLNDEDEQDVYGKIKEHFWEAIPIPAESSAEYGFTYYKKDASDVNFKAVNFMLELDLTPSFVAIWTQTKYSITFVENGGTSVSDVSEHFGEEFDLPTTTKTGHVFAGWFTTDPTNAEEFDENSEVAVADSGKYTMTDVNLTFYAKWTPNSHKLTIVPNNNQQAQEVDVGYGTPFAGITLLAPNYFEKTGHSLTGWYTVEELTEGSNINLETFTMPDNDLTIYAAWQINSYTITLRNNHGGDQSIFDTITANYNATISLSLHPEVEGYEFDGWCVDAAGQFRRNYTTMPAENIELYACFVPIEYTVTFYIGTSVYKTERGLLFGDVIPMPQSVAVAGYNFAHWCTDELLTTQLDFSTMPSRNISLYAKLIEKLTISIGDDVQTYTLSQNGSFKVDSIIKNFVVQYLVDDEWTIHVPTKKGKYDVKITRNEDEVYKNFEMTINDGLVITPDDVDLSTYSLILYCVAGLELICAIIILFLRKHRKTYLTYAVTLPFGVVSNSGFVNFVVSSVLAVFGFALIVIELAKLKAVNNEIAKISTEAKEYVPPDVSESSSISRDVEIILEKNGFISSDERNPRNMHGEQNLEDDFQDDKYRQNVDDEFDENNN